jgi:hypothetical protein
VKACHLVMEGLWPRFLAHRLTNTGMPTTWGRQVPLDAKYVVQPTGHGEVRAGEVLAACRELRYGDSDSLAREAFVVTQRRRAARLAERPGTAAVAVTVHEAYLKYVADAVRSVEAQTLQPCEKWLICDTCRPPAGLPPDWRVVQGEWHSPGPGRSEVVRRTAAEWITWLDADDAFPPEYVATVVASAKSAAPHVGVVYPDVHWCDRDLQHPSCRNLEEWCNSTLPRRNYIPTPSLWRVEALREAGGWPCGTPVMDDWRSAMNLRRRGWTALHVPQAFVLVRQHGENNSRKVDIRPVTAWHARRFAIVTLQAGRGECLDAWATWLHQANLPPLCDLWVLDDSPAGSQFADDLAYECAQLEDSGRFGFVVRRSARSVPTPPVRDQRHTGHARVAWLYNAILPDALRCSDFCLLLEDDVAPPPDALYRLAAEFQPNTPRHVAGITALYPPRGGPERVTVSSQSDRWVGMAKSAVKPGFQICGGIPGGCSLYDSDALLSCLPMRFTYDGPGGSAVGWDGNTARRLAAAGWQVAYLGDLWCEHRCG